MSMLPEDLSDFDPEAQTENSNGEISTRSVNMSGEITPGAGIYIGIDTHNKPVIIDTFRTKPSTCIIGGMKEGQSAWIKKPFPSKPSLYELVDLYLEVLSSLKKIKDRQAFDSLPDSEYRRLLTFHTSVTILD